jgi:hypothetical protein
MAKDDELYIGSISETISVKEQRDLAEVAKQVNPMLTESEYKSIMLVYGRALDRILKENGVEEKDETQSVK